MRKLFFIIMLLSLFNCKGDKSLDSKEKYFNPKDLSRLSLEAFSDFWDNDTIKFGSNPFVSCSAYLEGVELLGKEKGIGVAVFESQEKAINCMEARISTVANIIRPGDSNKIIKEKWWFTEETVFVNQCNTIAEVYYYYPDYDAVKTLLIETAAEIARRIDSLSN